MFQASIGGGARKSTGHCSSTVSTPPPSKQQQQHEPHEQQQLSWGDYLPPGLAPASPSSPVPLFSPSQQKSSSVAESVLHSIFSPSFLMQQHQRHNTSTSGGGGGTKTGQQRHHQHHRDSKNSSSSKAHTGTTAAAQMTTTTATTTPPPNHHHERHQQRPTTSSSIPRSLYMNANDDNNNLMSPLESRLFSPAQQQSSRSLGWRFHTGAGDESNDNDDYSAITASIAAAASVASVSTWKTYSLEHITSCRDALELQQIMNRLQAETATPCPSLLRAAQERLKTISKMTMDTKTTTTTTNTAIIPPPPPPPSPLNEPSDAQNNTRDSSKDRREGQGVAVVKAATTTNNTHSPSAQTATGESSLVYSEDGSQQFQFPLLEQQQQLSTTKNSRGHDRNSHNKRNNKHVPSATRTSSINSSIVKVVRSNNCNDEHHQELQAQVGRLTDTIVELDQRHAHEEADFSKRLQDLRLAESRAGDKIQQLQKDLSNSQLSNQELLESLEDMQEDVKTLTLQYRAEQTARVNQAQQYKHVEARLTGRIQQLVQQLEEHQQKQQAAAAAVATKKENAADPVLQQQQLAQLHADVQSLQYQLESVRKERNAMLRAMIDATGQNVNNIKQMAGHDRRCLIADFAKRSAASKSAFDAMTKALTLSEMERRQSIELQRKMAGQIKEMVQANARLEENSFQQIQQLSADLAASRAHVDELLQSVHVQQQKDYQEREVVYQQTIRNLKKQICSQSSMVPARHYKSAIAEMTRLTRVVSHLEQEIVHQQDYFHHHQQQQEKLAQQSQQQQQHQQQQPWQVRQQQLEMGRVDSQCSSSKENSQPLRAVAAPTSIGDSSKNDKQISIKSPPPAPPRSETKINGESNFQSPPSSSGGSSSKPKSKRRQEVVRQHGGRKGLQERIQAVRSVAVATTAAASNKRE